MSELMFTHVFAEQAVLSQKAKEYCDGYAPLNSDESWRWTPLSVLRSVPRGVIHADYQIDVDENIEEVFGPNSLINRALLSKQAPFAALNIALLNDTLTFTVPNNAVIESPIAINIDALGKKWQFSQIAIEIGNAARATFWIDLQSGRSAAQNCIITLNVADHAVLEGVIWQTSIDEQSNASLTYLDSHQGEESRINIVAIQNSCALSRLDVDAHLEGENAHFDFGGVQLGYRENVADYHVQVRHHKESGNSRQIIRGVLSDQSLGIFDGLIYVAEGAQLTDAQQNSRFILLSEQAKTQSVPRLEIYADDVKCAHGSTIGFIDEEALFYMQSRGISRQDAQQLLLMSFLQEAIVIEDISLNQSIHDAIVALWMGENDA